MKPIHTNSHAALQLVTPAEQPDRVESVVPGIGTIRVKKLSKGPATFSVTTLDYQAARQEAPAGKENGETPSGRPAGRKKPSAKSQKAQVPKKKARSGDRARNGTTARHTKTPVNERADSKKVKVLALLERRQGATLQELMKATGWQPHSVRGFLSGTITKKMGVTVKSEKRAGERVYSIKE